MEKQSTLSNGNGSAERGDSKKSRSPAYPSLSLQDAIAKAKKLYEKDGLATMGLTVMAEHWESTVKSSTFLQNVATLRQFGLLEEKGVRQFKLTKRALDILMLDEESNPVRTAAIKAAALAPKMHSELWREYGTALPSDSNLTHQLVTGRSFQEPAAKDLIRHYKKTLAFAKLSDADKAPEVNRPIEIGDSVQWESQGALQFPEPRKVTGKSSDGDFVFVDNLPTGVPIGEVRRIAVEAEKVEGMATPSTSSPEQPPPIPTPPPANPNYRTPTLPKGSRQDTFSLDEGPVTLIYPANLSEHSLEDFKDWVELAVRKIERSIRRSAKSESEDASN